MNPAAGQRATRLLNEVESKQMLEAAGIPTATAQRAASREEAVRIAAEFGFPAVLKILSPDIAHKSDMGGVRLGLDDASAVAEAYDEIMAAAARRAPHASIEGVSVQRLAALGVEVIVGVNRDPQFGPVIMFGLGGVFVEVMKDVAFRLAPLSEADADELMSEPRGAALLTGYRGGPAADLAALRELLLAVSRLVDARANILELDLNPVFVYPDGLLAVDARVVLEASP